ncbi:MAG TPA: amidohydrolase family protein [Acidimicrobiia bacterium]|jgi:predicted TIM-barrel fold metal-dependent hydrolase
MVVDYQSHWYPEAYLETILDRDAFPRTRRGEDGGYVWQSNASDIEWPIPRHFVDLEVSMAQAEADGIDVVVCSPNMVGDVTWYDVGEARETIELVNGEIARAQREYAGRFVGLAMLPLQDTTAALEALEHAIGELELKGVCAIANIRGGPIATPDTLPVYERIEELGVPLFLHPGHRSMSWDLLQRFGMTMEVGLSWMFDTSAAALSLVYSGTLDACPTLQVVHPHAGGVLPYLKNRILGIPAFHKDLQPVKLERPVEQYFTDQFWVDSVAPTPGSLEVARELYGADRVVFASDFPWLPRTVVMEHLRDNVEEGFVRQIYDNQVAGLALPAAA